MKTRFMFTFSWQSIIVLLSILLSPIFIYSTDLTGIWKAEFETQIGIQKYIFIFNQNKDEITGTASSDIGGEKLEVKLTEIKLDSSKLSFVEMLPFQGSELRISYQGILSDNEIKLTRNVGDYITEELVAKREKTTK